jgi:hypothetical protein
MDHRGLDWLQSHEAMAAARSDLERLRLPISLADDVLQEARLRYWRLAEAHVDAAENPKGVARRAMKRAVLDLHRLRSRRVEETVLDDLPPGQQGSVVDPNPVAEMEDACRQRLWVRLGRKPRAGAAALHELTFRLHGDVPIPDSAPRPVAGSDDKEIGWAALWLAGRDDCFSSGDGVETAAIRRRRSRALEETAAELRDAVDTVAEVDR